MSVLVIAYGVCRTACVWSSGELSTQSLPATNRRTAFGEAYGASDVSSEPGVFPK